MNVKRGRFLSLEGIDGSGKSQLCKALATYVEDYLDQEVVVTKEPGASLGGHIIRDMLFNGNPGAGAMASGQADCLLLFDHIGVTEQVIKPALKAGKWVVCDRYADSQFAYSAAKPHSKAINEAYFKHFDLIPDVTFLLIGDVAEFNTRAKARDLAPDALEPGKQQRKIWSSIEQQVRIQDQYLLNLSNQHRTIILNIAGLNKAEVARLAIEQLEYKLASFDVMAPIQPQLFETIQ